VPKRVFVAFAIEDVRQRDFLKGQSLLGASPFEYIDMSVKEPWSEDWKTKCRSRIRACDGVIALISRNTLTASGAKWEIRCSIEEAKPLLGIWAYSDDRTAVPEMAGENVVPWTWDAVKAFINAL
jgi:nucleoside 2-deoxyribosyltransferase